MTRWHNTAFLHVVVLLLLAECFGGEKSQLKWLPFNEAIPEGKRTGKKVMIDVYTDWCGWCKKMDRDTYTDRSVVDYLDRKYVSVKLNAESANKLQYRGKTYTERELAAAFGVTGYPSIIFLRDDGEPITVYPGYADAKQFKVILSYIAEDNYKTMKFEDYAGSRQ